MKAGEQRRLAVSSTTDEIRVLAEFACAAAAETFSEEDVTGIEVAVVEAANNILKHSYKGEPDHIIELTISHKGTEMEFALKDTGPEFDISKVSRPELKWDDISDIPESGRGVFIIREIMDRLDYIRTDGINILKMVRVIAGSDVRLPEPLISECSGIGELKVALAENETALEEMAEELSTAYESLNLFYTLSKDVALISDLDSFLNNTLEKALGVAGAEWGVVRLKEKNNLVFRTGTVGSPVAANRRKIPLGSKHDIEGRVSLSLARELDHTYNGLDAHVLCLPIVGLDEFLGTILLGKSESSKPFTSAHAKLARALADQIAISIENNRLYSKVVDAELAEKEMEIATRLQKKLILETLPTMPGMEFYIKSEPAKQVGGDYLTLYKISDSILYLIVSDAMGKGMSASYFSVAFSIS